MNVNKAELVLYGMQVIKYIADTIENINEQDLAELEKSWDAKKTGWETALADFRAAVKEAKSTNEG